MELFIRSCDAAIRSVDMALYALKEPDQNTIKRTHAKTVATKLIPVDGLWSLMEICTTLFSIYPIMAQDSSSASAPKIRMSSVMYELRQRILLLQLIDSNMDTSFELAYNGAKNVDPRYMMNNIQVIATFVKTTFQSELPVDPQLMHNILRVCIHITTYFLAGNSFNTEFIADMQTTARTIEEKIYTRRSMQA